MNTVETTLNEGIFTICLSRAKQFNALNWDMLENLRDTVASIKPNRSVRCVVIEGKGDNFMAGGDIVYFSTLEHLDAAERKQKFNELISEVHRLVQDLAELPVPVIAKVRGAAAGFGISLVAGCDLAIGSRDSFYTSAYNLLGVSPDGGSTYYIPRTVGLKKAMEIVLTSKRYNADEAVQLGLINEAVDEENLDAAVEKLARSIVKSARKAVTNSKRLVRQSLQNDLQEQLKSEQEYFLECADDPDFSEGIRAFVEKRKANFAS